MANVIFKAYDLPKFDSVTGTELMAKRGDGEFGYVEASQLQTTLDGNGLATDTDISASNAARVSLSGSVATTLNNTSFAFITGSNGGWNDASASAAGIAVGGLYHSQGTVKVRLS